MSVITVYIVPDNNVFKADIDLVATEEQKGKNLKFKYTDGSIIEGKIIGIYKSGVIYLKIDLADYPNVKWDWALQKPETIPNDCWLCINSKDLIDYEH